MSVCLPEETPSEEGLTSRRMSAIRRWRPRPKVRFVVAEAATPLPEGGGCAFRRTPAAVVCSGFASRRKRLHPKMRGLWSGQPLLRDNNTAGRQPRSHRIDRSPKRPSSSFRRCTRVNSGRLLPRGHRSTNHRVWCPRRRTCLLEPQGRIREVSAMVRLYPLNFGRPAAPKDFAIPSTIAEATVVRRMFNVPGGRRTKVWRNPTRCSRAHCLSRGASCELASEPEGADLGLFTPAPEGDKLRSVVTLRVTVSRNCLGRPPPASGSSTMTYLSENQLRPWSRFYEPEPCSTH